MHEARKVSGRESGRTVNDPRQASVAAGPCAICRRGAHPGRGDSVRTRRFTIRSAGKYLYWRCRVQRRAAPADRCARHFMQNYPSRERPARRGRPASDPHFMPDSGSSPVTSIPLSRPSLSEREHRYVNEVLRSDRLAMGPFLAAFEQRMAGVCGTRHAVAVSSGTAALHLIVRALGLGPGDEVLTTPFSFVASANAALYEGARVRFADIDPDTFALDPGQAARALTPATRALLAVDVFGVPADWPALAALAERHGLHLIDDACEALGAHIGGRPVGAWGAAAAFGFYPNKQITLGEGGCITTNDDALAARCRSLRNQGRADDARMEHVDLGFNYRLDELSAALGCAQLERLETLLARRAAVAAWYAEDLADLAEDLTLPPIRRTAAGAGSSTSSGWRITSPRMRVIG
ncbi:hypothetical protein AWN76_009235 [Rhodothermaceae bacterium RA]|nr:hypothetical protein AWN76_009235 [Rhodothermaceae bacterium RA]